MWWGSKAPVVDDVARHDARDAMNSAREAAMAAQVTARLHEEHVKECRDRYLSLQNTIETIGNHITKNRDEIARSVAGIYTLLWGVAGTVIVALAVIVYRSLKAKGEMP
ncbi:MAG: hypothetical protein KGL39_07520 [Patescibacteria group bacterium]|nr:hypothetical protein [Patescibacteria group bacterium]